MNLNRLDIPGVEVCLAKASCLASSSHLIQYQATSAQAGTPDLGHAEEGLLLAGKVVGVLAARASASPSSSAETPDGGYNTNVLALWCGQCFMTTPLPQARC